ncbi:hypothetical protein KIN20_027838 [Parelaphostrongylus tenuis]|uniref:Uncharacterized protein n=1 Tax=Parelaphostrongylus tenuis TaxID=148309 RepID=A0AAD5WE44_PARTN|nr:hypothetical protein KIN20_027838 [Parelaphostrongylus tenuis]
MELEAMIRLQKVQLGTGSQSSKLKITIWREAILTYYLRSLAKIWNWDFFAEYFHLEDHGAFKPVFSPAHELHKMHSGMYRLDFHNSKHLPAQLNCNDRSRCKSGESYNKLAIFAKQHLLRQGSSNVPPQMSSPVFSFEERDSPPDEFIQPAKVTLNVFDPPTLNGLACQAILALTPVEVTDIGYVCD